MAVAAPSSSIATTSAACLSPQLPLISLRETVAKINMPAVVQATSISPQIPLSSTAVVTNVEPMYSLTISNGEIIHSSTTNVHPKIAAPSVAALADYAHWLSNEEKKCKCSFIRSRGKSKQGISYYNCSRSGYFHSQSSGKRQLKAQGTKRTGYHCTAQIVLKEYTDHVDVKYYKKHYRHDFLLSHIPLSQETKQTVAVSRDFKNDPVTTSSQKPIIVTVSGMPGMTAGKHLTSATNVLTTPLLSAPVHMVTQHFTTDKIPSSNIVTLPTISRITNSVNPILAAKPQSNLTPLLPGSILTSKGGQLVLAGPNNSLIAGSSAANVMTTMSGIGSIVTVTPVIVSSTAPLVTLSGNSAVTLNPVSQAQVLSNLMQSNGKQTGGKALVPTAYLKPVNIAASPVTFPVAVQPANIAPAPIAIAAAPPPAKEMTPTSVAAPPAVQKEVEVETKSDPFSSDYDVIHGLDWKDGVGKLPGSNLKFRINEFGTLEIADEMPNAAAAKSFREENAALSEDSSSESRQKATKNKEMYQDENSAEKITQNGVKDTYMAEELVRCENCDIFGLKMEFCKSGRFCCQSCVSSYANKRNAWLKRGAAKEKFKRKKLKVETSEDNGITKEVKKEESVTDEPMDTKKEISDVKKKEFCWEEYLKQENAIAAPVKLFKDFQNYPCNGNAFMKDMKLEGIDHKHPSLFCVLSVMETRGYRVRLHFDGYSECYDFWVNADSPDIFPVGWCEKTGHQLQPPKGFTMQEFEWESYLKMSKAEAAPKSLFSCKSQPPNPNFKRGMKLEAVDKKNSSLVCVATITDVLDNRFLIHFDGWEDVYDYWADASSPHLHPVNWCRDNDQNLTPPKETKENVTFNWTKYLADTRSTVVPPRAFKPYGPNEFKVGMKLEAVDRRNPILIRVATIVDKTDHSLLLHFDGWSSVYDYWVDDNSPDIHPINWCAKTGHPLEPPIVIVPGQTGPCPTPGCLGQGHIKGPKYTSHHSAFGCPYSQLNLNKLDSTGQDRVIITKESLNEFTKKISDQGGTTDGLRRCPTPGCNGVGHVKGKYSVHHRVSGCPLAEKNALKVQQSNAAAAANPTATSSTSTETAAPSTSTSTADTKSIDTMKTRNGVGRGKKKFKMAGTGLRGRPPKHLTVMRLEAMKKAREATEKKTVDLEEKIHDSVFSTPFLTPPKELPLSWEHNTQLIPGLSSIKGSAVRQWSVNQVAKFVSSLKGCLDQGKMFREQMIDGEALLEITQSDLIDILHLKLGPALKVFSSIIAFKESEKFE